MLKKHYPALDGLRGLAALAVFLLHYGGGAQSSSRIVRAIAAVLSFGWTGVDLFFVLSGFLITGILLDTRLDPNYYQNFYARRTLRILPPYLVVWGGLLAVTPWTHAEWHWSSLAYFAYIGNPLQYIFTTWKWPFALDHTWSLSVEEQFYAIWATVVRRTSGRTLLIAIACISFIAFVLRVAVFALHLNSQIAYAVLFCRADSLTMGAALAVLIRLGWSALVSRAAPYAVIIGGISVATMCLLRSSTSAVDVWIATLGYTLIAFTCAGLVAWSLVSGSPAEILFSWSWLRELGRLSYGFYLYHVPIQEGLRPMIPLIQAHTSFALGGLLYVVFGFGLNLLVAHLSYHYLESRILKLKRFFEPVRG
jgi:peptidoglycan/LPS O-acetylase OafA/YrhL